MIFDILDYFQDGVTKGDHGFREFRDCPDFGLEISGFSKRERVITLCRGLN